MKENYTLVSQLPYTAMPLVELDSAFYKLIDQFEQRFAGGAPSLINCQRLQVRGDVIFGSGVSIQGNITLENRRDEAVTIADGSRINEDLSWD